MTVKSPDSVIMLVQIALLIIAIKNEIIKYPINQPMSKEPDEVYRPNQALSGILQYSGKLSDHGSSFCSCSDSGFSPGFGNSLNRCIRYPYTSKLFIFAVSIILKHSALTSAPPDVSLNRKFFLAIANGFTARSALLFVSSSLPCPRNPSRSKFSFPLVSREVNQGVFAWFSVVLLYNFYRFSSSNLICGSFCTQSALKNFIVLFLYRTLSQNINQHLIIVNRKNRCFEYFIFSSVAPVQVVI